MTFPFTADKPAAINVGRFCYGEPCKDKWGNSVTMVWCWCSREPTNVVYCEPCFDTHPCGMGHHGPDCPNEDGDLK